MEQQISQFVEGIQTPINKLSLTELRTRESTWRALWSWLDEDCKYYILRVGQTVRIIKRDYKGSIGKLGSVKFQLAQIELQVVEKTYNYTDGKQYIEDKVVLIPSGAIMMQEFIADSQLASELEQPDVMGIDEADAITSHNDASK